ncbi:hypothetical protein [Algoriphagus namhaensis]
MNFLFVLQGRVLVLFLFPFLGFLIGAKNKDIPKFYASSLLALFGILITIHAWNAQKGAEKRNEIQDEYFELISTSKYEAITFTENLYEFNLPMDFSMNRRVPTLSTGWISRSPFQKKAFLKRGFQELKDLNRFSLLVYKNYQSAIFPLYMNHLTGNRFELIDYHETKHFDLYTFQRP